MSRAFGYNLQSTCINARGEAIASRHVTTYSVNLIIFTQTSTLRRYIEALHSSQELCDNLLAEKYARYPRLRASKTALTHTLTTPRELLSRIVHNYVDFYHKNFT